MDDAIVTIEDCATAGKATEAKTELFWAVKFIDRYANKLYDTTEKRKELLDRSNGSWELRLALNSDKDLDFYPHPEFRALAMAFTTVSDSYFGKGIATNDKGFCFVALAGPSTRHVARRQVFMNYEGRWVLVEGNRSTELRQTSSRVSKSILIHTSSSLIVILRLLH